MTKEKNKKIIDYGPLNDAITAVESTIQEYNHEERELIVNHVRNRIITERQKANESEVMSRAVEKLPFGLGNMLKKHGNGEEKE